MNQGDQTTAPKKKKASERRSKPPVLYDASTVQSRDFERYIAPDTREIADANYVHLLAHPRTGEKADIPLSIGGLNTKSTVTSVQSTFTFEANAGGDAWVTAFAHSAPVDGVSGGLGSADTLFPLGAIGDRQSEGAFYSATAVAPGILPQFYVPPVAGVGVVAIPASGLTSTPEDSECRLVAAEIRVFPISATLTSTGTGMMIRPAYLGGGSLQSVSYQSAYAELACERVEAPLPGWKSNHCFRALWYPERVDNVQYGTRALLASVSKPPFAVFMATGCVAGQKFRAEIYWVFGQRDEHYTMSKSQAPSTMTMADLQVVRPHLMPHVVNVDHIPSKATAAVQAQVASKGPSKAGAFWNMLANGTSDLFQAGVAVAPSLLQLANTLVKNKSKKKKPVPRRPLIRL